MPKWMRFSPLALVACMAAAQTTAPQKPVLSAWTELVGDDVVAPDPQPTGHTVLRVITSATTCP